MSRRRGGRGGDADGTRGPREGARAPREPILKADGDTWAVRVGERPPAPDRRHLIFLCRTTDQRPYRVVEVPASRVPDAEALAGLPEDELAALFAASRSMDFPRSWPTYDA